MSRNFTLLTFLTGVLGLAISLGSGSALLAQGGAAPAGSAPPAESSPTTLQDPLQGMPGMGSGIGGAGFGPPATWSAEFQVEEGNSEGRLSVTALLEFGWYIYSTTQPPGGPKATELTVDSSTDFEVTGPFEPNRDPEIHAEPAFPGVDVEKFSNEVTWTAPIRLSEGTEPENLQIQITVDGQVCDTGGTCELVRGETVQADFGGYYQAASASGEYRRDGGHVTISGHFEPKTVAPGDTLALVLTAELDPDWYVYKSEPTDPEGIAKPTLIVLRKTSGWSYGQPTASPAAKEKESGIPSDPIIRYHPERVSWTVPIEVPEDAAKGEHEIAGSIAYQTCTDQTCDQPTGLDFQATVTVADDGNSGKVPLAFQPTGYSEVAKQAESIAAAAEKSGKENQLASTGGEKRQGDSTWASKSLPTVLALAFLAGLILNVMPCVLPVIGLKVMSFVQQAGGSRREILGLNLWFSLGLMSVFWILAAAAAFAGHRWGQHFGDMRFLVTMIGIVFAFGLSFLGVWEIPIPGFVGSGKVQEAAEREGPVGAFSKGILSTILATPCAGPLLVPAVSWAVVQPAGLTFLTFTSIGLGMATPYLLIGIAPGLVAFLPKPGEWMDTFKQAMGFLLMATVVFLFVSVSQDFVIPTLTLLLGIAIACWIVGRTPATAEVSTRVQRWASSLIVIAAAAVIGFVFLVPDAKINWQPYSRVTLDQFLEEGNTVMVDFTADW